MVEERVYCTFFPLLLFFYLVRRRELTSAIFLSCSGPGVAKLNGDFGAVVMW